METAKKPHPVAACDRCHTPTNHAETNIQCPQTFYGNRCKGHIVSVSSSEWKECLECEATGQTSEGKCERCEGWGWSYLPTI